MGRTFSATVFLSKKSVRFFFISIDICIAFRIQRKKRSNELFVIKRQNYIESTLSWVMGLTMKYFFLNFKQIEKAIDFIIWCFNFVSVWLYFVES